MSFTGLPLVICYIVIYGHQNGKKPLQSTYHAPTPEPLDQVNRFEQDVVLYYQPGSRAVNDLLHDGADNSTHVNTLLTQFVVTKIFINYWQKKEALKKPPPNETFSIMMMPEPPPVIFTREAILQMIKSLFVLLYFGLAAVTAQSIVQEKESRIKESMKLMGLQTFSFWFTWFLTSFVFGFSPCIIFTVAFCVLTYENGPILYSDPVVIMAVLTLYSVNIISFCCMMSCFISKGRNAAISVGTLYFLLMFASPLTFQYLDTRRLAHIGGGLLFQSGIGHFLNMLMDFEKRKMSLTFDHMLSTEVLPHLNALDALVMLLTNTLLNCLIVWYMDNVHPGEYGITQPYHFFLTTTYWCPKLGSAPDLHVTPEQDVRYFEQPSDDLAPGIKIRNLLKVFNGHPAVCRITLDLYQDQITVLLGHNGAGKTTTINMITGFLPPTKGTAIVNGFDVTKNLKEARRNVGLCPQHDILFPSLTCEEHLVFYSKLREQYDRVNTKKEIDTMLEEVELTEKRKCYSAVLSGGQKRKLSVACSFIGGSQIVFLDEPSSGLDPSARRELWNFLKKKREGRTILLTTHYMDEADILGDRIVIMAEGVVKCYGTSNFLKRIYGTGYHMNIVKLPDCDVQEITETIQKYIPEVKRTHQTNNEIFYLLPEKDVHLYSKMMLELENKRSELKIESFGVVATSLEDVFVRVGEGFEPKSFLNVDKSECRHYIAVARNSRNWASSKLSIVQTKHRRNWASSKPGIVIGGHSHDWASSKPGIVIDGHSTDWASSKLGIVKDGHSHDWASSKLGIVIDGHSYDWASSKLGIVIDGHSHDWASSKLGIVMDGHSHDWASSRPSGYTC
ncbi:ATP-binding cassette sub- A member 3 [Bulinus truncatus]|nr:ATP-binding cassette sub- A member 3 [Bulinus truncatus]